MIATILSLISLSDESCDQLAKFGLVITCITQKFMLQQLISTPSLCRVLDERLIDEILEHARPALFKRRWAPLNDVHDDTMLGLTYIGRVAIGELHCEDAV